MMIRDIDFCTHNDISALCHIEQDCFIYPWSKGTFINDLCLGIGPIIYLKASLNDNILIAYTAIECSGPTLHILSLGVLKNFRRLGIGTQLMLAADTVGTYNRCRRIKLETRPNNHHAIKLYTSLGLSQTSTLKEYYRDGEDALIFFGKLPLKLPIPDFSK